MARPAAESRLRSILVANGNDQERNGIAFMLESLDYSVDEAATVEAGLFRLANGPGQYGLAIVDANLPSERGDDYDAAPLVRDVVAQGIPLVYISLRPRESQIAMLAGNPPGSLVGRNLLEVLQRPYDPTRLAETARRMYRG